MEKTTHLQTTNSLEELVAFMREEHRIFLEKIAESDRQRKETDLQIKESDRLRREADAKYAERQKKIDELMGSWHNNHGSFAEEYFYNSFEKGERNFFGEKFDKINKHAPGFENGFEDEYDILLINGKSVGIIEVKFKAHENDIPKCLRKAETFRVNYPNYKNHQVYLALASMAFYPELEEQCRDNGIAIIKQVGDHVVVWDEHLKAY
jgi:hypothetical protein